MSEVNMEKAQQTYEKLCSMLDSRKWNYDRIDDKLTIKSGVKGDDLPIDFVMRVNPRNEVISFFSWMPYKVPEDKRVDLALAICTANYGFVDGSFDFDLSDGSILFRLTSSYKDTEVSTELLEYMLVVSASTVDAYNDKFFMISKGMLSLAQFIESEKN